MSTLSLPSELSGSVYTPVTESISSYDLDQLLRSIDGCRLELLTGPTRLNEYTEYILESKGKLLRPLIALSFACLGQKTLEPDHHDFRCAAAIELLHEASLVHDDVLDASPYRRGKQSVGERFTIRKAAFTGDFMIIRCLKALSNDEPAIMAKLGALMKKLVMAQFMEELPAPNNIKAHQDRCFAIIQGKTGLLFSLAAELGASINSRKHGYRLDDNTLTSFSHNYATAFQMRDDLADLTGDPIIRKPGGNDFLMGNATWPFLFWAEQQSNHDEACKLLADAKGNPDAVQVLCERIIDAGVVDTVRNRINSDLDASLASLPTTATGPARDLLGHIVDWVRV